MSEPEAASTIPARVVIGVVLAALVVVLVAAHVTPTGYRSHPGTVSTSGGPVHRPPSRDAGSGDSRPTVTHQPTATWYPGVVLTIIEAVAAAAILVVLVRWLLAQRRRRRRPRAPAPQPLRPLAVRLVTAADEGLADLEEGEVDDAIITCWLRLRDAVIEAGVEPRPSDTPADVVRRVLAAESVRTEPLHDLAELYREARFSRHAMPESARTAAVRALLAIRADLAGAHV